jgi:hypothetical protein
MQVPARCEITEVEVSRTAEGSWSQGCLAWFTDWLRSKVGTGACRCMERSK